MNETEHSSGDAFQVEIAIGLALRAHAGQLDKGGKSYHLHWMTVASRMKTHYQILAAILHDTVEDSKGSVNFVDLAVAGIPSEVVDAVDALTKRKGESNDEYLARVMKNEIALSVKIEDLKHNMDLTRLSEVTSRDHRRGEKYRKSLVRLEAFLAQS